MLLESEPKPVFEVAQARAYPFNRARHYAEFALDWFISYLWVFLLSVAILAAGSLGPAVNFIGLLLIFAGLGLLIRAFYRFGNAEPTLATIEELMSDPYASPVRGRRVALTGRLVGRGIPGYVFSEDFMFEDKTGIIYVDYEHWLPVLGNLMFAVTKAKELIGKKANCDGWFFRGFGQTITLNRLEANGEVLKSKQRVYTVLGAVLVMVAGAGAWILRL